MSRVPTERQYLRLSFLGVGVVALAPARSEWAPLLKHGWVEPIGDDDRDKRFLPPLRITPEGLRAVAAYLDRHPLPDWPAGDRPRQLDESPTVTGLREKLAEAVRERDTAQREALDLRRRLLAVSRTVERETSGSVA